MFCDLYIGCSLTFLNEIKSHKQAKMFSIKKWLLNSSMQSINGPALLINLVHGQELLNLCGRKFLSLANTLLSPFFGTKPIVVSSGANYGGCKQSRLISRDRAAFNFFAP